MAVKKPIWKVTSASPTSFTRLMSTPKMKTSTMAKRKQKL